MLLRRWLTKAMQVGTDPSLCAGNVLLTEAPREAVPCGLRALVGDFGLARDLGGAEVLVSHTYGTVDHQAPEVLREGHIAKARPDLTLSGKPGPSPSALGLVGTVNHQAPEVLREGHIAKARPTPPSPGLGRGRLGVAVSAWILPMHAHTSRAYI